MTHAFSEEADANFLGRGLESYYLRTRFRSSSPTFVLATGNRGDERNRGLGVSKEGIAFLAGCFKGYCLGVDKVSGRFGSQGFETGFFEVRIKCLRFLRLAERVGVQGQSLQVLWRCMGSSLHLRPSTSHQVTKYYL